MKAPSERSLILGALAALLPCLAAPISNPDLFWHLAAARRMAELRAIPSVDWLSSTLPGAPWTDFEWLTELLFGFIHQGAGMAGLWAFKVLLMIGAAGVLWKTLELYELARPYSAAALAFWAAASWPRSDLRPEWFSVVFFGLLFWRLEARRLGRGAPSPGWALAFFGIWANLHAGFAFGLLLLGIYAAAESIEGIARLKIRTEGRSPRGRSLWIYLAVAAAGTLIQPFGLALYEVLWRHWAALDAMRSYVYEWGAVRLDNPGHWPYWILLFASFGAALRHVLIIGKTPLGPLGALFCYSFGAFESARLAAYQVTLALPLAGHWAAQSRAAPRAPSSRGRWACLGMIGLCAGWGFHRARAAGTFASVFQDRFIPVLAARFLEQEKETLSGQVFYNDQFGWGGYLAFKLYPDYRIFQDGRYIFHPFLDEAAAAAQDPQAWAGFMDRYRIDVALMENIPRMMETTRLYPDGATRVFLRPYYAVYMPKRSWALVHWDDKALIFARRGAVPGSWLSRREFKYALPFDGEARGDALRRREIPARDLEAELRRHDDEIAGLRRTAGY